jgi:tetratricopeptide (TPR) repeat protein
MAETINAAGLLAALQPLSRDERSLRIEAVDPTGDVLVALADEAARMTTTDAEQALEATSMMTWLADDLGHDTARARARRGHARALSYVGRYDEALVACEDATVIAAAAGDDVEAARARLASMHALTEMGKLEAALVVGEAARDALEALGEAALAARADINLGIVHQRRDKPSEAVRCFERARTPLAGEATMIGYLESNRGEALLALNDFAGAEEAFQAALEASDRGHMPVTAAIVEGNLADLAARQGHLQDALFHFERARRLFEVGRVRVGPARAGALRPAAGGGAGASGHGPGAAAPRTARRSGDGAGRIGQGLRGSFPCDGAGQRRHRARRPAGAA